MPKKEVKKNTSNKKKTKKENILVFGAHPDDFVIGVGGTIAKYAQEGKKIISIIFSYGVKSHPWLKEEVVKKMRSHEALEASERLGCKIYIYDLEDTKIYEDYQKKGTEKELFKTLARQKPSKIFTHSPEDPHPDHQAVNKITLDLWENLPQPRPEVYVYSIWNPLSFKTGYPVLYEDITATFSQKLKALKLFRSQRFQAVYPLLFLVFYRAIKNGLKIKKRFAEKFYRVK